MVQTRQNTDNQQQLGIVVDRSGSMHSLQNELISGLNVFCEQQKNTSPDSHLICTRFDNVVELVVETSSLKNFTKFSSDDFVPRGMTSLHDAVKDMVCRIEANVPSGNIEGPNTPIIVILTDGAENSSLTSKEEIATIVKAKRNLGWKFIFMGANQDALEVGSSMGMNRNNCMTYSAEPETQDSLWRAASNNCTRLRTDSSVDEGFTQAERLSTQSR